MSEGTQDIDFVGIPAASFGAMQRALAAERGVLEAAHILRNLGIGSGAAFYELFRGWLSEMGDDAAPPEELDPDQFWARLSDFFAELGWGRLRQEQIHPGVISVTATNWIEARRDDSQGGCHFTTGVLAEILRRVAGQDLAAMEVECAASGSPRCRLLLGSPDALNAVFARMREGEAYVEAVAALGG